MLLNIFFLTKNYISQQFSNYISIVCQLLLFRPPCGLTRQEVQYWPENGLVPVVGGRCQNPYDDAAGVEHKCGRTVGAHPSETAPAGKMTPPLLYSALTQLIPLIASVIYIFSDSSSSFSCSLRTDSREGPGLA